MPARKTKRLVYRRLLEGWMEAYKNMERFNEVYGSVLVESDKLSDEFKGKLSLQMMYELTSTELEGTVYG